MHFLFQSEMLGGFTHTIDGRIRLVDGSTVSPAPSGEELGCGGSWLGDLSMPGSVTQYLTKKQWQHFAFSTKCLKTFANTIRPVGIHL